VTNDRLLLVVRLAAVIAIALTVTWLAWLSDDALITLRHSLNAAHGFGPVFNVGERVQGYTHPLWFLLLTFFGWLTGQWMLMPMLLGIGFTTAAVAILFAHTPVVSRIVVAATALLLSNSFVEYATSGLENSLSYALLAGLIVLTHRLVAQPQPSVGVAVGWGLLAAGVLLNRLDLALLIAPIAVFVAIQLLRRPVALIAGIAAGVVPLMAWFGFSLAYYGSLLPTTFTAKTNVDIPRDELLISGLRYFATSFAYDPIALVVLIAGVIAGIVFAQTPARLWLVGVGLYLAYVVWIGGDFMAGRFLAVPVFVVVAVLATESPGTYLSLLPGWNKRRVMEKAPQAAKMAAAGAAALIVPLALLGVGRADILAPEDLDAPRWNFVDIGGVADERGFYMAQGRGLWQYLNGLRFVDRPLLGVGEFPEDRPLHDLVQLAAAASAWSSGTGPQDAIGVTCGGLGTDGISTGPGAHWIDPCGLTDPFIASIPFSARDFNWRIGHFVRVIPKNYIAAVEASDVAFIEDEILRARLAEIWERIR
jgi:arabinofuranosyltransferase